MTDYDPYYLGCWYTMFQCIYAVEFGENIRGVITPTFQSFAIFVLGTANWSICFDSLISLILERQSKIDVITKYILQRFLYQ